MTKTNRSFLAELRRIDEELERTEKPKALNRRVLRVAGAMLISNGLTILLQLLMVPALIWAWGASLYGEWLILYTIPGYLSLTDFGIIATANNRIEAHCARRFYIAANRTYFNSVIVLLGVISLVTVVATLLWVLFGHRFSLLFETLAPRQVAQVAALLFTDAMVVLILNHHSALYRTLGKFNWTINWQAIARVAPTTLLCIFAMAGASIIAAATSMLAARIAVCLIMGLDLRRRIDWLRYKWLRKSGKEIRSLLRGAVGFMTLPLANMIYLHVTTLMIAAATTPTMVATFSTMRTFTRMIPQFVAIAGRSRWSEISKANARGEGTTIKNMQRRVVIQTCALSTLSIIGYLVFGRIFYEFWTGGKLPFDRILFFALLANAATISLYYSLEVFLLATNQVSKYAKMFLAATLFQIGAAYLLVEHMGISAFPAIGAVTSAGIFGYVLMLLRRNSRAAYERQPKSKNESS